MSLSTNPFDLFTDNEEDVPTIVKTVPQKKVVAPVKQTQTSNTSSAKPSSDRNNNTSKRGGRGGFRGGDRREAGVQRDSLGVIITPADTPMEGEIPRRNRPQDSYQGRNTGKSQGAQRAYYASAEDGHQRGYERRSKTGRNHESEIEKKGGSGRGNWGSVEDDIKDATTEVATGEVVEAEKVERPERVETEEDKAKREEREKEREKEEKQMTLDAYMKKREEERTSSGALSKGLNIRTVDDASWASKTTLVKRDDDDESTKAQEVKKGKGKAKKNTVNASELLNFKYEAPRSAEGDDFQRGGRGGRGGSRGRGDRGGRGGNRGGNRGGDRNSDRSGERGSAQDINFSDPNSFPTLNQA